MRRNKVDSKGIHPWKAEVTENDTNKSVVDDWYNSVYEPTYTTDEGGEE